MQSFWKGEKTKTLIARVTKACALCFFLSSVLYTNAASADVALAVKMPKDHPVHRDYLSGIIDVASARWQLMPGFAPAEVKNKCPEKDEFCAKFAKSKGASHVLFLSAVELGASDFVVLIKIIDIEKKRDVLTYNDLATPGKEPRAEGKRVAETQFAKVSGLPLKKVVNEDVDDISVVVKEQKVDYNGFSTLSLSGWGLVGASALAAIGGGGYAASLAAAGNEDSENLRLSRDISIWSFSAATTLAATGLGLIVWDAFIDRAAD